MTQSVASYRCVSYMVCSANRTSLFDNRAIILAARGSLRCRYEPTLVTGALDIGLEKCGCGVLPGVNLFLIHQFFFVSSACT